MFDVNEKSYIVVYIFAYENESMFAKMDISMDSNVLCNVNYFCNINTFPSTHIVLHSSWIQIMKIFKSTT